MPKIRHLAATFLLLGAVGCAGAQVKSVWDTQFDFAGPTTYAWAAKEPESGSDFPYDELDRAIKASVERSMSAAGFTQSNDNPSLRVTYYLGAEEVTRIDDDQYYGRGWSGYWGYGWYGPAGVNVSLYDPGTITVDVLSTDPGIGLIWRGVDTGALNEVSAGGMERAATNSVGRLFEDFPPAIDR